jgi:predicted NAD-dependent protein-ADP-ribosyltransferase YbiA (DUF1768 family)
MVKSDLHPDKINYNENKSVDDEDIGHSSSLYELVLFGIPIQVGIGKEKYTYSAHNVVYYSLYLIINDIIKSRIGVVEYDSNKVIDSLDDDGDLKLENGHVIFFVTKEYLQQIVNEANKPIETETNEQIEKQPVKIENEVNIDNDVIILEPGPIETVDVEDDETDVMRLNIPDEKRAVAIKNAEIIQNGLFEEIPGFDMPSMLETETKEMTEQIKTSHTASFKQNWISKFMKNNNYDIIDNEGNGDCFFAVIRDAFAQIGKKTTVEKLRAVLSEEVTENTFQEYKSLYNAFNGQYQELESELVILKKTSKTLKARSEKSIDKDENKQILNEATKVVDRYNQLLSDKKDAKRLLSEFEYMKNINSIDEFKQFINTKQYWADTWALSTLERVLNIKMVVLSEAAYKAGDLDAVLNCGQLNDTDLERQGNFKPDYYIMTSYTGSHYTLITYKKKGILKFSEVPYDIKALIVNKCMERNSGPYYLIQDLRNFKIKIGLDANEGEPQENEEDYTNNDLYDKDIVFMFHHNSNSTPRPGKGSGEHVPETVIFEYNKLSNIPDWRKKLDDSWYAAMTVDNLRWQSVEHYYLGSQFKKGFPDFYRKFALDSESEISKDISLARIAGSKTGKTKDNVLRDKHITVDPDFYEVTVQPRNKTERLTALIAKFNQNLDLKHLLLETKRAKLVHFIRGREPEVDMALMKLRQELTNN